MRSKPPAAYTAGTGWGLLILGDIQPVRRDEGLRVNHTNDALITHGVPPGDKPEHDLSAQISQKISSTDISRIILCVEDKLYGNREIVHRVMISFDTMINLQAVGVQQEQAQQRVSLHR